MKTFDRKIPFPYKSEALLRACQNKSPGVWDSSRRNKGSLCGRNGMGQYNTNLFIQKNKTL